MGGPVTPPAAQRAAELTELGGFAIAQVSREGLLPLTTALEATHLGERFAATRAGLATGTGLPLDQVPPRTAVSAAQVGLVSRFWSIALASVALHAWVPDLTAEKVWVADSHRNPSPIAVPDEGRSVTSTGEAAEAVESLVLQGAVAAVTRACGEHGRTAVNVLVSNAASGLVAAAGVVAQSVPDRAQELDDLARRLLHVPWLAAGGGYRRQDPAAGAGDPQAREEFKRRGCCLYYRLPGHGLCPDCVLVRQPS